MNFSDVKCLIILPTYNEVDNIEDVYKRIRSVSNSDILFIDDGSNDGTLNKILSIQNIDSRVFSILRDGKRGLGDAYRNAFKHAIENSYAVVIHCDADGSHELEKIPRMLEQFVTGFQLVIGSRYIPGGEVIGWAIHRKIISKLGNIYATIFLRTKVKDNTSGFRLYSTEILQEIDINQANANGYAFQVQMTFLCRSFKLLELPIKFVERKYGKSKMTIPIALEALWRIPWIKLRIK